MRKTLAVFVGGVCIAKDAQRSRHRASKPPGSTKLEQRIFADLEGV